MKKFIMIMLSGYLLSTSIDASHRMLVTSMTMVPVSLISIITSNYDQNRADTFKANLQGKASEGNILAAAQLKEFEKHYESTDIIKKAPVISGSVSAITGVFSSVLNILEGMFSSTSDETLSIISLTSGTISVTTTIVNHIKTDEAIAAANAITMDSLRASSSLKAQIENQK